MLISSEQTRAAMHGTAHAIEWSIIDRPVGPSPLVPEWCKGVHVNWMDEYSNSPDVRLKVHGSARRWENKRYRQEGDHFRAYHPDGRMEQYSQKGPLRLDKVKRWQSPDGSLRNYAPTEEIGTWNSATLKHENPTGKWIEVDRLCTRQEQGFGGSHYDLTMEDGTEIVLRGPWHTSGPEGYSEVAYVDVTDDWARRVKGKRKWWQLTGMAGLHVRDDVFVAIMSRFAPHLELASVKEYGIADIQPLKPEWDAPKCVIREREWQKRQSKVGAA